MLLVDQVWQATRHLPGADPLSWMHSQGVETWSKQREIVDAVVKPFSRVLVPSANGTGKTHIASWLAAWFAQRWRGTDSRVVIIGSSWDQLRDGTHAHISNMNLGEFAETQSERHIKIDGRRAIVWRSPPKGWTPGRRRKLLQGLHARRMLVIIEEANEIPPSLWAEATVAIVTGGDSHILGILNPTDPGTPAHQSCSPGSGWTVIPISMYDTPNLTGEDVSPELRAVLPTQKTIDDAKKDLTPAEYSARVLGKWPESSEFALIDAEWIKQAQEREARGKGYRWWTMDPGSGGDPNTVYEHCKDLSFKIDIGRELAFSKDRELVGSNIAQMMRAQDVRAITVDTFGVGADHALAIQQECASLRVTSINSGDKQKLRGKDRKRYVNPRSKWGWSLRKDLSRNRLTIPRDNALELQLKELRQKAHPGGLLGLEPKEEMSNRLGRSPDDLDCILMRYHRAEPFYV